MYLELCCQSTLGDSLTFDPTIRALWMSSHVNRSVSMTTARDNSIYLLKKELKMSRISKPRAGATLSKLSKCCRDYQACSYTLYQEKQKIHDGFHVFIHPQIPFSPPSPNPSDFSCIQSVHHRRFRIMIKLSVED